MLFWIVDNVGLFYVCFGFTALALGALVWLAQLPGPPPWKQSKQRRPSAALIALGANLLLLLLLTVLTFTVSTDRGQLRRNLLEMADAVAARKPAQIARHLSESFRFRHQSGAFGKKELTRFIAEGLQSSHLRIREVYLWELDIEKLERSKGTATVAFRARVYHGDTSHAALCRAEFVLEGEHWCVRDLTVYNPFVNTDQPLLLPLR